MYYKHDKHHFLVITLYVDDMLSFGNNKDAICDLKSRFSTQLDMKDFQAAKYILGMEIKREGENRKLWLIQIKYVNYVLWCFHMSNCKPLSVPIYMGTKLPVEQCPKTSLDMEDMAYVPYASVVGSLMYAMVCPRPGISQVMGLLILFMDNTRHEHWDAVKRVFRYLWGAFEYSIFYLGDIPKEPPSLNI